MTRAKRLLGWLVFTAVTLLAVVRIPWRSAFEVAAGAKPAWLLVSVGANALILVWVTLQWRLFLPRTAAVPLRTLAGVVAPVATVSNAGPVLLGYGVGMRLLMTRAGLSAAAAASVLTLEQLADSLAKLALTGVAVTLMPAADHRVQGALLLVGLPFLASGLAMLAHRPRILEWLAERSWRPLAALLRSCVGAISHLETLRRPRQLAAAIALGVAKKGTESLGLFAVSVALDVHLPLWVLLATPIATNLALAVTATPAGLGVFEGAAFLVFRAAGVEATSAAAMAVLAHLTYLVPLIGVGWGVESFRVTRRTHRGLLIIAAIAGVGVAVHLWFALGGDALDSDAALVILMARHFAHGEWAVFFWQQSWMANLEPLLLMPFAAVGLATPLTAGLVAIALTSALAALSVRLAQRLGGTPWMALLVWAVPPALVVHHHVTLYGARLAATLLMVLAFSWSLRAASRGAWVGVGVLTGLAFFGDHLMIAWAVAVLFVAARRGALRAMATGALPVVAIDACAAVMTPAFHLIGPNYPSDWLLNVPLLLGTILPQLFGLLLGRGPTPDWELPASIVPVDAGWLVLAIPGAVTMAVLAATLVRHRRALLGESASAERVTSQALLLLTVTQLGLFVLVGGRGEVWSVRYLVPLWPAISVFASVAVSRWRPRWRPLAVLAVLPAAYTLRGDMSWPRAADAAPARAEANAVRDAVAASGVQAVWAEYWDAYRMALLIGERPRWVTYRVIERRPDWAHEARDAHPVAYLVRAGDAQLFAALDSASMRGIRRIDDRVVGRFRLVVMERSVPGLEFRNPAPSRAKQVAAALAADTLFVGALLAVALLATLFARTGGARDPQVALLE